MTTKIPIIYLTQFQYCAMCATKNFKLSAKWLNSQLKKNDESNINDHISKEKD